jgi:hypothetical protein
MSDRPQWTGRLRRGAQPGTITGELIDAWGWVIHINATFDGPSREYVVEGRTGDVPPGLRIPAVDEGEA